MSGAASMAIDPFYLTFFSSFCEWNDFDLRELCRISNGGKGNPESLMQLQMDKNFVPFQHSFFNAH
jgi:hypothetical protein